MQETEHFFWTRFTDTYLELAKSRARDEADPEGRSSAVTTLRFGLKTLLRMFAPFLPYVTEEIWSWVFAAETGEPFIHAASWPRASEFAEVDAPSDAASFETAVAALAAINKAKADAEVSMGREVERLVLAARDETLGRLRPVLDDVLHAARCRGHELMSASDLDEGAFDVRDATFVARPEAS